MFGSSKKMFIVLLTSIVNAYVIFQKILQLIICKKTGLKGTVKVFFVDYNATDTNILDIHRYLMKKT